MTRVATAIGGKFANGAVTAAFAYVSTRLSEDGTIEALGWKNPSDATQGYGYRLKLRADGDSFQGRRRMSVTHPGGRFADGAITT